MALMGIDLGGTKVAIALFTEDGSIITKKTSRLERRKGFEVSNLIGSVIRELINSRSYSTDPVKAIGISVPGISRKASGTVWAPNIPGWEDFPLADEIKKISGNIPIDICSDRSCYILGEAWKGNAAGCSDAIFLSVGTGIGAGIMTNGTVVEGSGGIAGAAGWLSLDNNFIEKYTACGFLEYYASGEGMARAARELLSSAIDYDGFLILKPQEEISSYDIFEGNDRNDPVCKEVIRLSVIYWGMTVANLVSIFNPEKIILGGGLFGPAARLIPAIVLEASKWAQPLAMEMTSVETSALGGDAGIYGAAFLSLKTLNQ